jgi:hypothetical protein
MAIDLHNFVGYYEPPFRYCRIGQYTGCDTNHIEDDNGVTVIELPSDISSDSDMHDAATAISKLMTVFSEDSQP